MERVHSFPPGFRSVIFTLPSGFQPYADGGHSLGGFGTGAYGALGSVRPDAYYMGPRYTFYAGVISPESAKKFTPGQRVPFSAAQYTAPVEYEISAIDDEERAFVFRRVDPSAIFAPESWGFTTKPGLLKRSLFMTEGDTPAVSLVRVAQESGGIEFEAGSLIEPQLEPAPTSFAFAEGSANPAWPLASRHKYGRTISYTSPSEQIGSPARQFMASRGEGERFHAGVDLYANVGDVVLATEPGVIVNAYHFYHGTYCLIEQCDSGLVVLYGELEKNSWRKFKVGRGTRVQKGSRLARVGKMSGGSHMLHMETYRRGTTSNERVVEPGKGPILDPTRYLLLAKATEDRKHANA